MLAVAYKGHFYFLINYLRNLKGFLITVYLNLLRHCCIWRVNINSVMFFNCSKEHHTACLITVHDIMTFVTDSGLERSFSPQL